MISNMSQNTTSNESFHDQLWSNVGGLTLIMCVLMVAVGNLLVMIDIRRRPSRTLTGDLLIQLLLCDIFLVLLLPLVVAFSLITNGWVLSNSFCLVQGLAVEIFSTTSCLLRMMLAFERRSLLVKRHGMKITLGTGIAISLIFLGMAVLIALLPKIKRIHFEHFEGLHSCYINSEWLAVSTNLAVLFAPCVVTFLLSLLSLKNSVLGRDGNYCPKQLDYDRSPAYFLSTDLAFVRFPEKSSPSSCCCQTCVLQNDVIRTNCESEPSQNSVRCISTGQVRSTLLLPILNMAVVCAVILRLCFIVASHYLPNNEIFHSLILACYILPNVIQTGCLLSTIPRFRSTVHPLQLKSKSSIERDTRPIVVLAPRDTFRDMPTFLKPSPDIDVMVGLRETNVGSKIRKQVSLSALSVTSCVSLKNDRTNVSKRRVTITVV